jgi:YidC/Oxa1 family membrane protein insertase
LTGDFFLTTWIFLGMRWLSENVLNNSIFWTIFVSTVILRIAMLPFDIAQRKNLAKQSELSPKYEELKKRYKNDPNKLNAEYQKLLKESGSSTLAGCLPVIFTLAFLFSFIAAFRFWSYEQNIKILVDMKQNIQVAEQTGEAPEVSETFLQAKFLWINNIWQPDNGFKPVVMDADDFFGSSYDKQSKIYKATKDLIYLRKENPDVYKKLEKIFYDEQEGYDQLNAEQKERKFDEAKMEYEKLIEPLQNKYKGYNNGFFILPVLATLFQFLYAWYTMKQQKTNDASAPGAQLGKFTMYVLPVMSFFFCLSYTAAFAIYWTLSSAIMLITNIALSLFKFDKEKSAVTSK